MTLKDIAAIAGKPGLFKVVKPTRNGMIVEALVGKKNKFVVNANHRVSVLKEISVYTTGKEESLPLLDVFLRIKENHQEGVDIDLKSSEALFAFMEEIVPDYDQEKVYASDVKKITSWYNLLLKEIPEVLVEEVEAKEEEDAETKETPEKQDHKETENKEEGKIREEKDNEEDQSEINAKATKETKKKKEGTSKPKQKKNKPEKEKS